MAKMPPIGQLKGRPLGRVLIKMGLLTREKVREGLTVQKKSTKASPIGQILLDLGYVSDNDLKLALAFQLGMSYVDVKDIEIADEVAEKITTVKDAIEHVNKVAG